MPNFNFEKLLLLNLCRQDGGDTVPPKAVQFSIRKPVTSDKIIS